MVCSYGMSDKIGPVSFSDDDHDVFLGRDFMQRKDYSERKAQEIDEEVTKILSTLYDEAFELLSEHRDVLDRVSEALLERETLDGAELKLLLVNEPLPPMPVPIASADPPVERADAKIPEALPGDKLPDPEPVPG
jgi:cell division protease FtsH